MNQYEQINHNNQEKIFYNNNANEITEEINQSNSANFSQLERDILILINFLRTNPIDFCNNLFQKFRFIQNKDQIDIINYIEETSQKQALSEYIEIPELSNAARYLLDNISLRNITFHDLNLKQIDPNFHNLRARLSKYGERTGRIFETVLFKMDNPDDIVYHILKEEKGRNMLLSYKMKYIGIACDMLPSNYICTVIDIVQDFVPFRAKNNNENGLENDDINSNFGKNDYLVQNNCNAYNNSNFGNNKRKYFNNQSNSEYISLINNLNYKNSKDNLKLKIKSQANQSKDIESNLNNIQNDVPNLNQIHNIKNNEKKAVNNQKNIYFKTPIKLGQNSEDIFSPKSYNPNNIDIKKIIPKRNNSNFINIKNDLKNNSNKNNEKNVEDNNNFQNNKFTMAGRTYKQQQEIIEKSIKNLTKSKSVCSFDATSNYSKNSNKNKFQRLNHQEKMEILHKINHRNNKTPNSQSPRDKNSENAVNIISNNKKSNDDIQKNINNYEINFENKSRRSPSRSEYNQEYYEINSETDKNNYNALNKYMSKDDKNNYDDGTNQTLTDLKSNQGLGNNEEYSRNKISEIKNELLYFKNEIKKELKDEVREEIRNELNKKMLIENKQRNKPTIIQLEPDYDIQMHNNNYNEMNKRNSHEINNEKIYYKNNNIRNNYYNKNKEKNRWSSSVEKYYYIKNNNNNINNINNTNIILPNNNFEYKQYTHNNYYKPTKPRKSFDLKEFINNDKNHNESDDRQMKEKFEQLNYIPIINNNDRALNNDDISNYSRGSNQNQNINKENSNKKNMNESYFIEGYKMNNRQDIKKLIKLYNIAKEDKRNKSIIENNNVHDIINNNKSITNYNFNQNESKNDNIEIDINGDLNNSKKININNNILENNFADNNSKAEKLKRDFNNNYNNNFNNNENNANNEEEDNSGEGDFIKGHRFQIKYEKVKPKGQIYNKSQIPKPRNSSVKKAIIYITI